MSSRPAFQTVGYDPYVGDQHSPLPPPPPPLRDGLYSSPRRRQHGIHSPVLTTGIGTHQGPSQLSTPLSSISHHSPFTVATPSDTPTMASRTSGHFSVPYDPRDWAPGTDPRVAQIQRLRENAAEDGLASPPPPYTITPTQPQQQSIRNMNSPSMNLERAQTLAAQSPNMVANFSPRQNVVSSRAPPSNRHSIHMGSYMPPPPSAAPPIPRSRVVSDINHNFDGGQTVGDNNPQPPTARRAASASAGPSRPSEAGPSRSSSRQRTWMPGMPLPGPPPGPPPPSSSSRSQSTSGAYDRPGQPQPRPRALRQTMQFSDLGPIPATPNAWTEDQPLPSNSYTPLHIDTNIVLNNSHTAPSAITATTNQPNSALRSSSSNPPANLSRSSAVRDSSVKGLRERRAQNRNSLLVSNDLDALSVQTNPWADALTAEGSAKRQDAELLSGGPRSGPRRPKATSPLAVATSHLAQLTTSPIQMSSTPPISPMPNLRQHMPSIMASKSAGLTPKSLPTPPISSLQPPLSANSVIQARKGSSTTLMNDDVDIFQREAAQRHADFLEKEKQAKSDIDRLQLFAEFILHEAALRQKKYEAAFNSGDFDIEQLRINLFNSQVASRSASNSISQVSGEEREANTTNTTPQARPETMWWKDYHPELSPIASMDYDEMDSRGRPPSRWWESQTGSQSGGAGPRKVHRSKRESKYMGLSKEFLMSNSPSDEYPNMLNQNADTSGASVYPAEKVNPDTFGYFDGATPRRIPPAQAKKPEAPALLDISRFITLPPPYPRHHPAVNNNHPNLAQYRTTVRTLGDLEEIKNRKARHNNTTEASRVEHKRKLSDSRRSFRSNIQAQVADGNMSFAEAAEAEENFKMSEFDAEKQCLKAEFDTLQDVVINPLHDMLHERISQLDASIKSLQDDLHADARYQDPDQPQQEGDEKPELLEKLTQLKWLFDVREQIHRECFELMSARNDKYKAMVLLPYQYAKHVDKIRDTESFFGQDTQKRYVSYCSESLKRHEDFLEFVEQHVRRGVELQSSAFWDIAPGLLDLLQKIPDDLRSFDGIRIPEKEYKENPSYHKHPEQYLYSLLSHTEKSTYQFIEGQVNLQCLLHEIKSGSLIAKYRVMQMHDGSSSARGNEFAELKASEDAALTAELKQKASMIEEQWLEALGSQLQAKRERVKTLLQEADAWEEIAAEDG